MIQLTEIQRNCIVNEHFLAEQYEMDYPGMNATKIATELVTHGKCIISGTHLLWDDENTNGFFVMPFLTINPLEGSVDCSLVTFDLDSFLKTEPFGEMIIDNLHHLKGQISDLILKFDDYKNLLESLGYKIPTKALL